MHILKKLIVLNIAVLCLHVKNVILDSPQTVCIRTEQRRNETTITPYTTTSELRESTKCGVPATIATQNDINELCTLDWNTVNSSVVTIQNESVSLNVSLRNACADTSAGAFVWISWNDFIALDLNTNNMTLIGRNQIQNFTEHVSVLCEIDVKDGACRTFNDVTAEGNTIETNLLVYRIALEYVFHDVQVSLTRNVTDLRKMIIAQTMVVNLESFTNFVKKSLSYAFEQENEPPKHSHYIPKDIDVVIKRDGIEQTRFDSGKSQFTLINKTVAIIKELPPFSLLNVSLQGTWKRTITGMHATLEIVYGNDAILNERTLVDAISTETTLGDIVQLFKNPVPIVQLTTTTAAAADASQSTPNDETTSIESVTELDVIMNTTQILPNDENGQIWQPLGIYPEFTPYAIVAAVIFFTVFFCFMCDVARKICQDKRLKKNREYYAFQQSNGKHVY